MKTLEQEAKEYANIPLNRDIDSEERYFNDSVREYDSFIAGANSKWVKAEKINAKIEGLLLANDNPSGIFYRISELEQQLNKLNYETKI
jgi:hypothetical protein